MKMQNLFYYLADLQIMTQADTLKIPEGRLIDFNDIQTDSQFEYEIINRIKSGTIAYIIYTSGTTGTPKGGCNQSR